MFQFGGRWVDDMKKKLIMDAVPLEYVVESLARKDKKENVMCTCVNDLEYHLQNLMNEPQEIRDNKLLGAFVKEVSKICLRDATRRKNLAEIAEKGGKALKENTEELKRRNSEIIQRSNGGTATSILAKQYGISTRQINKILKKNSG